jgi:predicted transcriptional regulator
MMSKLDHLRKQVWEVDCGGSYKLAMLYLAEKTRAGVAKVKIKDIASACCVSERRAQYIVGELVSDGYVHIVGNENGGCSKPRIYKITNKKGEQFSALKGCNKVHPLYICVHKEVRRDGKPPNQGLISANDAEINNLLLARGL